MALIVSCSGFDENIKEDIKSDINKLGGIYKENMTVRTKVLIANKINTKKCIAAKDRETKLVNINWLRDSLNKGMFEDPKNYQLKCFEGLEICLFGFEEIKELKKIITSNKGFISESFSESDIIIIKSGTIFPSNISNQMELFMNNAVKEDWIYYCVENKKFINYEDDNYKHFKFRNDYFETTLKIIEDSFNKNVNFEDTDQIFRNLLFHISEEFDKQLSYTLKRAISLGGGIIYNKITPLTTHIICNENKHTYTRQFSKLYSPNLINQDWVFSSLKERKLLNTDNFKPINIMNMLLTESNKEIRNEMMISSRIFKDQSFFIVNDSYNITKSEEIKEIILSNSGELVSNYQQANIIIINDEYCKLSYYLENKIEDVQLIVSHRYLELCQIKNKLINLSVEKYLHVFPLSFHVPNSIYEDLFIYFYDFNINDKNILEMLIETLGGKISINYATHVVVNEKIEEIYREKFKKHYKEVKFVTTEWLVECIIYGKKLDESLYLVK